jgi:2-polyprenyl-6-methoxyphenol hydroxylase-like FAD-dependent oxidoreductase
MTSNHPGDQDIRKVLICGGGIAGLTLGILLQEKGWNPQIVERDPALRTSGYMMDFFGTGWDVAERMGLLDEIQRVRYPIERIEYVDRDGTPRFPPVPLDRIRRAFGGRYTYIRRPDLARILLDHATSAGIDIRFGATVSAVQQNGSGVQVTLDDGTMEMYSLLFGADGVHSIVRELVFGPESAYRRFLGYYISGFSLENSGYELENSVKIYEEPGYSAWFYPVQERKFEAMYIFRHNDLGHLPHEKRLTLVKEQFKGAGWIAGEVLGKLPPSESIYFDAMTQILMPTWRKGRIVLLGDACGCLSPLAGQGSHMAMAEAFVLAGELERYRSDYKAAFQAYEQFLKPIVAEKQEEARRFAGRFVPSSTTLMIFRYLMLRIAFSPLFIRYFLASFGAKSILGNRFGTK